MSFLSFSFNPSLLPEQARIDFVAKFTWLSMEYQYLTGAIVANPAAVPAAAAVPTSPDASEIPPPSDFVPLSEDEEQLDGGASQVSAAKPRGRNTWANLTEEQRIERLGKMSESRIRRKLRKMSEDSLASEKPVHEMNHKELCKKYRDLRGRKHNPKYPYGGVPKAFSQTENLRVEVLRLMESELAALAAPAEMPETSSEASAKKPRKRLTEEQLHERRAKRLEKRLAASVSMGDLVYFP